MAKDRSMLRMKESDANVPGKRSVEEAALWQFTVLADES